MKGKIVFLTIVILILTLTFTVFKKQMINPFQKKILIKKTLEKIESINMTTYQGARYYHKALFPYDFIIGDPNWGMLISKSENFLTKEDKLNKYFYYKCKEIGIDLNKNKQFFIIETRASAGFIIDEFIQTPFISYNYEAKTILLQKPNIKILKLEIIDNVKSNNYPDISITPKQWQQLVSILLPIMKDDIVKKGIIEKSETKSLEFIETIYKTIGWSNVEFK